MRIIIKILCLFIILAGCKKNEESAYSDYKDIKEINSVEITDLTKLEEGKFFYPKFTASETKIVFTTENYTGLWYYDLETKIINQLNPSIGAGLSFDVSKAEDKVYFKLQSTSAKGDIKNYSIAEQDVSSKKIFILYTSQYYLSEPKSLKDGNITFLLNSEIKILDRESKKFIENYDSDDVIAFADGMTVKFRKGEIEQEFAPIKDGNIIWVEVSSNNHNIYFTSTIDGTGVYNIDSKEITWIGDYRYLRCASNSNLMVFSYYENLNSDLFLKSENDLKEFNLTNTKGQNELFPSWSKDEKRIIFNTADGILKMVKFKIKSGSDV